MLPPPRLKNNVASGVFYFKEGLRLVWTPELRVYILVPLLVNCVLFFVLTGWLIHTYGSAFTGLIDSIIDFFPDFFQRFIAPLAWIVWFVCGILFLIVYGYSFNMITNIIAAPFYGLLSAKAEALLTGNPPPDEPLLRMIPRVMGREISKLWYFLSRGVIIILIMILVGSIPVVNLIAPAIGLAWSAWSMSIQYADYAGDNNQLNFKLLRMCLWQKKFSCLGFGGFTMLMSVIPVINIVAIPVAVVGGTLFWLRELKSCHQGQCEID